MVMVVVKLVASTLELQMIQDVSSDFGLVNQGFSTSGFQDEVELLEVVELSSQKLPLVCY